MLPKKDITTKGTVSAKAVPVRRKQTEGNIKEIEKRPWSSVFKDDLSETRPEETKESIKARMNGKNK